MTAPDDLCFLPATRLAAMIRERELSPVEIVDAVFARLHATEPKLNAFIVVLEEEARGAARTAEQAVLDGNPLGPLHGVPIGIKDFIDVAGVPTTFGSHLLKDNVPPNDAVVTARARAAGAIIIGKTTGPDYGWKATGDCPLTGITRNPWNLDYTPGGSSAGAAATVAAGVGPIAIGTDGAGSVRIPASFCGIFGMKPSYGRVPQPGQSPASTSHTGPMSRTVADGALLLQVIAGPTAGDPVTLGDTPADYPALLEDGVAGKRIAYSPDLGFARNIDPEVAETCARAAEAFADAGAIVEEKTPNWGNPLPIALDLWPGIWAARIGDKVESHRDLIDPALVACTEEGLRQKPETFARTLMRRVTYCEGVQGFFDTYDFLLTPSVSVPAIEIGRLRPASWDDHDWDWISWAPFSFPFNFTWNPAATVPAGFTTDGRPIGLQIVGRRFDDTGVLQAAAAFERVRPWADARPSLV